MNITHRVIWSDAQRAFIVVSEHARSAAKPSTTRRAVVTAITLGLGSLLGTEAMAAGSCPHSGLNTLGKPVSVTCSLSSGATLNVTAKGAISVSGVAVFLGPEAATPTNGTVNDTLRVRNAGLLAGGSAGILLDQTAVSGLISNVSTGVIRSDSGAGIAVRSSALDGSVRNTGSIQAQEGTGIEVQNSVVAGNLDNRSAIAALVGIGVQDSTVQGSILDRGDISSDGYAIRVEQSNIGGSVGVLGSAAGGQGAVRLSESSVAGTVTNSGSLWSQQSALLLNKTFVQGNVRNSGTISGGAGIKIEGSRLRSLRNDGTVNGGIFVVDHSAIAKGIFNSGQTMGASGGLVVNGSTVGGGIANTGQLDGGDPLLADTDGLRLNNSTLSGGLSNSGSIAGRYAINLQSSAIRGDVANSGTLRSYLSGIDMAGSQLEGSLINQASGQMYGLSGLTMRDSLVTGNVVNQGMISSGFLGLSISGSTISGGLTNSGTLRSGIFNNSISSFSLGAIVNSGSIEGDDYGLALTSGVVHGVIDNSGLINGLSLAGVKVDGPLGNSGTIEGRGAAALDIGAGTILSGGITNSGTLAGSIGLSLDHSSVGRGLENSGAISGIKMTDTLLSQMVNSGSIINYQAGAPAILLQDSEVQYGGITNTGDIWGQVGGMLLKNTTVLGSINNSGNLTSEYRVPIGSDGLALSNSTIAGDIVNTGFISGKRAITLDQSTVTGSLINAGSIGAENTSLSITASRIEGDVVNTRSGGANSLFGLILRDSTVRGQLLNAGRFYDGFTGLIVNNSQILGGFVNSGEIISFGTASVSNSVLDSFLNTGVLTANQIGIGFSQTTINHALTNAGYTNGISLNGALVKEGLINSGTIGDHGDSDSGSGLVISAHSTITGGLRNSGIIEAYSLYTTGLQVTGSTVNGGIHNSGSILGGGTGVLITNSSVTDLINSGTLSGSLYSLASPDGSLQRLTIAGDNTAVFNGEVLAPLTHLNIAQGTAYTPGDGSRFTVADFTNYGTLNLPSSASVTIAGNYVQDSGATLSTQAANASTFGRLQVTGTATLADGARFNVDVTNSGQSFEGATLASVLSAGTLNSNGTYAVTSNSALYNFSGVKDGNSVDLVATPKSATAVTQAVSGISTTNLSAARALDSALASNSSLTPFLVGATSSAGVASAVSQTLPSNAAAATQVSQSTLSTITDVVQSRINATTGLASGDGFYGDKNLWMKPFGSWINQSEHGGSPGYDASVYGMAFGVDAPVNELLRLGVSFSYANADTNSKADVSSQSAKVDLYQLMGYGSYTVAPNTELSFHAGVGQNRNDGERNINLNGVGGKASANYDSRSVTAGVALAKAFDINPTTRFIPSVRADYTWLQDDSYHEKGSAALQPLLLDVNKHQTDQLILGVDGKLSHEIVPGTQVTGNLGVGYDVIHDDSMLTSTYAGAPGQSFNTVGQSSSPWLARGGVGVSTKIASNGTELSVNYDAEARTDFTNQTVSLKLKMPF